MNENSYCLRRWSWWWRVNSKKQTSTQKSIRKKQTLTQTKEIAITRIQKKKKITSSSFKKKYDVKNKKNDLNKKSENDE
jgi:hypothetical protein